MLDTVLELTLLAVSSFSVYVSRICWALASCVVSCPCLHVYVHTSDVSSD